jgi:hypothetical protein
MTQLADKQRWKTDATVGTNSVEVEWIGLTFYFHSMMGLYCNICPCEFIPGLYDHFIESVYSDQKQQKKHRFPLFEIIGKLGVHIREVVRAWRTRNWAVVECASMAIRTMEGYTHLTRLLPFYEYLKLSHLCYTSTRFRLDTSVIQPSVVVRTKRVDLTRVATRLLESGQFSEHRRFESFVQSNKKTHEGPLLIALECHDPRCTEYSLRTAFNGWIRLIHTRNKQKTDELCFMVCSYTRSNTENSDTVCIILPVMLLRACTLFAMAELRVSDHQALSVVDPITFASLHSNQLLQHASEISLGILTSAAHKKKKKGTAPSTKRNSLFFSSLPTIETELVTVPRSVEVTLALIRSKRVSVYLAECILDNVIPSSDLHFVSSCKDIHLAKEKDEKEKTKLAFPTTFVYQTTVSSTKESLNTTEFNSMVIRDFTHNNAELDGKLFHHPELIINSISRWTTRGRRGEEEGYEFCNQRDAPVAMHDLHRETLPDASSFSVVHSLGPLLNKWKTTQPRPPTVVYHDFDAPASPVSSD